MTKKMNLLIGLAIAATMMLPMTSRLISTKAEVRYNEIDRLFESTITEIFDYEQTEGGAKVEAEKEWLYDINLCELGVLYDFAYKDKEGFAIIIDDGDVKVTEIYTEGKNPYSKENVKNVYVFIGTSGVWSLFMGISIILASRREEKEKAKRMLAAYGVGMVVIFGILIACPYLVKGIAAFIT